MAQITIEDLEVTSFFTETAPDVKADYTEAKTCYYYTEELGCEWTLPEEVCICTADISTCSRTSVEGGCTTDVQCVTV